MGRLIAPVGLGQKQQLILYIRDGEAIEDTSGHRILFPRWQGWNELVWDLGAWPCDGGRRCCSWCVRRNGNVPDRNLRALDSCIDSDKTRFVERLSQEESEDSGCADGGFVVPLVVGILMSLITLAHWIKDWLEVFPDRVWGFFLGLVFAMGIAMLSDLRSSMRSKDWVLLTFGIVTAIALGLQTPQSANPALWVWPIAGAMALSAMLLPGISGVSCCCSWAYIRQ